MAVGRFRKVLYAGVLGLAGLISSVDGAVEPVKFVRGDSNRDEVVNISDPVNTLNYLFSATGDSSCLDAHDVNNDGLVNIVDPVYSLNFQFGSGPAPIPPFPNEGYDRGVPDSLECDGFNGEFDIGRGDSQWNYENMLLSVARDLEGTVILNGRNCIFDGRGKKLKLLDSRGLKIIADDVLVRNLTIEGGDFDNSVGVLISGVGGIELEDIVVDTGVGEGSSGVVFENHATTYINNLSVEGRGEGLSFNNAFSEIKNSSVHSEGGFSIISGGNDYIVLRDCDIRGGDLSGEVLFGDDSDGVFELHNTLLNPGRVSYSVFSDFSRIENYFDFEFSVKDFADNPLPDASIFLRRLDEPGWLHNGISDDNGYYLESDVPTSIYDAFGDRFYDYSIDVVKEGYHSVEDLRVENVRGKLSIEALLGEDN